MFNENKANALSEIKGVLMAMKDLQEKDGEYAKVNCSVVEKFLERIKDSVEKI